MVFLVLFCFVFFFSFFFFFKFCLKTYSTLKMFVLSAQNNFYYCIEFICRKTHEKNSSLNFMSSVGFQASKIWMFSFWKIYHGPTISDKIFGTKWSYSVKLDRKRKAWYLSLHVFNYYLQSPAS